MARDTHAVGPEDFAEQFDAPPTAELLDTEAVPLAVPVRVEGSVRVESEPSHLVSFRTVSALATESVKVLPDDPRRDTATLVALDNDMLLGVNRGDATASWPVGVPLVIRATGEVWARGTPGATLVTAVVELRAR